MGARIKKLKKIRIHREGTNELIKEGATAITSAADILENYQYIYGGKLDLSVLGRLRGRSELRRGALRAHGVDEGAPIEETVEKKEESKSLPGWQVP